jgi:hypothetical protein
LVKQLVNQNDTLSPFSVEVRHQFDPTLWQSVPLPPEPASTLLVTWTLEPAPVDSGMPPIVQTLFAAALCTLGTVFYAADAAAQTAAPQIAQVQVRSGLRRRLLILFRAHSAPQVLPAFDSGIHSWSMNAQWLIVANPSLELDLLEPLARTLYQDWQLPAPWPAALLLLVQAGVDGDAAICHCRDRQIEQQLCTALRLATIESGANFKLLDEAPPPTHTSTNDGHNEPSK